MPTQGRDFLSYPDRSRGIGLGLAVAREFVEAFGGQMWYEPGKPRGATFHFTLRRPEDGRDYELGARRQSKRGNGVVKILVVDDEPDIRFLLRTIFESEGYIVLDAHHGAVALDRVKDANPDVIVTDLMMPVMGGQELIARLRGDPETARIPILAISAHPRLLEPRADAYLSKPFLPDDMLEAVDALIEGDSHGPA